MACNGKEAVSMSKSKCNEVCKWEKRARGRNQLQKWQLSGPGGALLTADG